MERYLFTHGNYIDIIGNEAGDESAKHALSLPITEMDIHYEGSKLDIKNCMDRLWQRKW